ncbi:alpha-glucosidase 2-like [Maniola hyperantus]|uniref:alpha-glucosidase 2-like n=1 Tax=Aphantopus hyperantus TaxID=2795564 RepID=UPI00156964F7|nr:alpha-glucosidase 2-like [Maniola hyperantus]
MLPYISDSKEELVDSDVFYSYEKLNNIKWYDRILLNRPLKVTIAFLLIGIAAPVLLYHFYFFTALNLPPSDGFSIGSCLIPREIRLACGVGQMAPEECHPQCCYDRNLNMCFHRIPSRFSYILDQQWREDIVLHPRIATVPFSNQNSVRQLRLSISEESATHMVLTFYNSQNMSISGKRIDYKEYSYEVGSPEINIVVNASQGTIFDTARGPLIASDNIWEIAFKLTNETMYGFGEIPLKKNTTKIIYSHNGDTSSIPLIFAKVNTSFHGLLIDVSEPTEILIHPGGQVVVRSITNFGLKFHLFVGPEPKGIMEDVMKMTGHYKQLEYWMLGIHVCSEVPDLDLDAFIFDATSNQMPFDSHCGYGPIVFNSDQCKTSNDSNIDIVNSGANIVKEAGKQFVPHVSPYIRHYEEEVNETMTEEGNATAERIDREGCRIIPTYEHFMYRRPNTFEIYKGEFNGTEVIYPSYNEAPDEFLNDLWAYDQFDGLVLENTWPLDKSDKLINETAIYMPYFSEHFENAFANTPQWNLTLINDNQLYLFKHNTYGNDFAQAFAKKDNTTPIWSSSLWMNGGMAINRQNIDASWTNLHRELIAAALGGVSGHWLWSSPVCGDTENFNQTTQSSLCIKWYLAATYFPMVKIHSKESMRYPTAFNGTQRSIIVGALNRRLGLLPYFYTTLQEGPLLRPMFYQYPFSEALHDINTQFSVGDILLIAPNLTPVQSHVHMWLPPGTWYELWSGLKLEGDEGDPVTMMTAEADFLTFIRGGSILIYQKEAEQTAENTQYLTPFSLIIALECTTDNETTTTACQASGKQFISKNMSLIFVANDTNLTITADGNDFDPLCDMGSQIWVDNIRNINIYGLDEDLNNYDNFRQLNTYVDLCYLVEDFGQGEIVVNLLS